MVLAWGQAKADQAADQARVYHAKADQDIVDQAQRLLDQAKEKELRAERLRYCFLLLARCKDSFLHLKHLCSV